MDDWIHGKMDEQMGVWMEGLTGAHCSQAML